MPAGRGCAVGEGLRWQGGFPCRQVCGVLVTAVCVGAGSIPEDHIGFGDGGVGGEEFDDGMGICGGDGRQERGGVEDACVEEVWRFCLRVSVLRQDTRWGGRTAPGFEDVSAECQDICGQTGFQEGGLVGRQGALVGRCHCVQQIDCIEGESGMRSKRSE